MHGCYDFPRPPPGTDPAMMYPHHLDPEGLAPHLDNGSDHSMMGGLARPLPEDETLLGDLDSSGYSLTSLDTIARSMDRGRPTEV